MLKIKSVETSFQPSKRVSNVVFVINRMDHNNFLGVRYESEMCRLNNFTWAGLNEIIGLPISLKMAPNNSGTISVTIVNSSLCLSLRAGDL